MSIYAYTGLPGSGKSYGVVANQVLPALKAGRLVVTNLPLKVELLQQEIPGCEVRTFLTSQIAEDPESMDTVFPPGCVAIIDECWRLWPAGRKVDKIPEAYKSFLAEHRHRVDEEQRSTQIVLVTQDLAQIANFARQLVETTFHHKKLGALGMRGKYAVGSYDGAITGNAPPESKKINGSVGQYKDEIWRFYESHTMSKAKGSGADETPVDDRATVWGRTSVWVGLVVALVGLGWGGTWAYNAMSEPGAAVGGAAVGGVPHGGPQVSKPGVAPRVANGPVPPRWRVAGWLQTGDANSRALVTDGVSSRWIPLQSNCRWLRGGGLSCRVGELTASSQDFTLETDSGREAPERVARQP